MPAAFHSAYRFEESVVRLREATARSVLRTLFKQAAPGRVDARKVRLQRYIPFFGNSFKPIFVGRWIERDGNIVLKGRFTMFLLAKVFMSFWLGFAIPWTVFASVGVFAMAHGGTLASEPWLALFPLLGIGFVALGAGFVRACWHWSRKDIPYLEGVIRGALRGSSEIAE